MPEDVPSWLLIARKELGVREISGPKSNPVIDAYLASVHWHPGDETPWCSAFVNWCIEKSGRDGTDRANARSWLEWGEPCEARVGAVCVLWRESRLGSKGHVAFYERSPSTHHVTLFGGNQGNMVGEATFTDDRVLGYRWPKGMPAL